MLPWFNKNKEQESYDNLKDAFDYEKGKNEEPLYGYNAGAKRKRGFWERSAVLEESEKCFDQVLEEEKKLSKEPVNANQSLTKKADKLQTSL